MRKKYKRKPGPRTYMGLPVEDAKTPLHFVVTADHCKKAKANIPDECAVALAIMANDHKAKRVMAHRSVIMVVHKNQVTRYKTPAPVRDQIIRIDGPAAKFEPGAYYAAPVPRSTIAGRGKAHSYTDLKRGDPNSKRRRRQPHDLGRVAFHYGQG